ncbi:MAG: glycosyl transferase, partial [Oceanicaulis sp.]
NTVHEIARVNRPFLCVPEWRYFNEQVRKAEELARLNAAHTLTTWPASNAAWTDAIEAACAIDLETQASLFDPEAARKIAEGLLALEDRLWSGVEDVARLPRGVALGARGAA